MAAVLQGCVLHFCVLHCYVPHCFVQRCVQYCVQQKLGGAVYTLTAHSWRERAARNWGHERTISLMGSGWLIATRPRNGSDSVLYSV